MTMKKYEAPVMEKVEFVPQDNMTVSTGNSGGAPTLSGLPV